MANATESRLDMRGIWKSFGGVPVLRDVNLHLGAGEVLALLGQNGAGKSTLIKILGGDYTKDTGTVRLEGKEVNFLSPPEALAHGVRVLPQELALIPDMSVAENIFMGELPLKRRFGLRSVDRTKLRKATEDALLQLGLEVDPDIPVKALAAPEQRVVEIARALAGQARVLVMDEPTAALTEEESRRLFETIEKLKEQGMSIIYISHRLEEVLRISDRVMVLRNGENAGEFETTKVSREDILAAMLGETMEALYPEGTDGTGEPLLEVSRLRVGTQLQDVSFNVRQGEIMGAFGLIGSGIGILGKALFGALGQEVAGELLLGGEPFRPESPIEAKEAGVGYVPADRKQQGILPDMNVRENMTLPFLNRYSKRFSVSISAEENYVQRWMHQLSIRAQGTTQQIRTLSGGNQQKVLLARWLVDGMKLLVLEEPTMGVDVGARKEIYAEVKRLAASDMGILLISSDAEEVAGVCDRIIVLNRGQLAGQYERGVSDKELIDAAT